MPLSSLFEADFVLSESDSNAVAKPCWCRAWLSYCVSLFFSASVPAGPVGGWLPNPPSNASRSKVAQRGLIFSAINVSPRLSLPLCWEFRRTGSALFPQQDLQRPSQLNLCQFLPLAYVYQSCGWTSGIAATPNNLHAQGLWPGSPFARIKRSEGSHPVKGYAGRRPESTTDQSSLAGLGPRPSLDQFSLI